eukprot:10186924-Alexandrium_andersonii.AAC.1
MFAEKAPPGEQADPPFLKLSPATGSADVEVLGRSRLEVCDALTSRLAGERSAFEGAPGMPRPSSVR